jgi:hypothetical protein
MAARIIKSMGSNLQTPQDIADLLTQRLRPHFAKHGMEFHCHIIESWRRIADMFPNVLKLEGAYKTRDGVEAPHSFTFCPRGCLPTHLQAEVEQGNPFRESKDRRDTIALVRQWMADGDLSQRPLLTYPASCRADAFTFFGRLNSNEVMARGVIKPERAIELDALAQFLGKTYAGAFTKAAKYISDLLEASRADSAVVIAPPPKLEFLDVARSFVPLRPQAQGVANPSALIPWTLKVVYSRAISAALRSVRESS